MSLFDRTFHPDEANQAFTTGRLLETGSYRYNPQDHHGPTLYYAAAAIQKAAGHNSTATLDPTLLRCTPLIFAILTLLFGFLSLRKILRHSNGHHPSSFIHHPSSFTLHPSPFIYHLSPIIFPLLLGTSPIFVFFATDFIQEMLLACFTMMMFWSATNYLLYHTPPSNQTIKQSNNQTIKQSNNQTIKQSNNQTIKQPTWALLFGIAAGLAFATKETSILAFAAAGVSGLILYFTRHRTLNTQTLTQSNNQTIKQSNNQTIILAFAGFLLTATLFYSSFASNWQGVYNAFIAAPLSYLHRATGDAASQGAAAHVHPWWQYLKWMFADEHGMLAFFSLCGIIGGAFAQFAVLRFRPEARALIRTPLLHSFTFMLTYALLLLVFYSVIPYKTPWCALQITIGILLAAFLGFAVTSDVYVSINSLGLPPGWPVRWKAVCDWWCNHPRTLRAVGTMPLIITSFFLLFRNILGINRINRDPDSKEIPYNYASASPQAKDLAALVISTLNPQQSNNQTIKQSNNQTIKQSNNQTIKQSNNQTIKQSNNPPPFAAIALPPEDTWPLPFYLRSAGDKVGYWTQFGELEALAGLGSKPSVVVVPAEEGHLVQPLFPHLKNTKRFEMRPRVRVRAFW